MLMIRVLSLTIDKSPIFIANNGNHNYELWIMNCELYMNSELV